MRVDTVSAIAAAAKGRRLAMKLSQAELAQNAGVSREWLNAFERGKPNVELRQVLRIFDALGLYLEVDLQRPRIDDAVPSQIDLDRHLREYNER